jgi:hypothetical protein
MYPSLLLSVFVALIALMIIGRMLGTPWMVKLAGVLMVVTAATAVILWLLMGLSPFPPWFTKWVARLFRTGLRAVPK